MIGDPFYDNAFNILVVFLYILPICWSFRNCIKNKQKLITSILVSVAYVTAIWAMIIIWFVVLLAAIMGLKAILPEWLGVFLGFAVGGLAYIPIGHVWQLVWYFYENFKHKGIYSFENIKHEN